VWTGNSFSSCQSEFSCTAVFDEFSIQHALVYDAWSVSTQRCNICLTKPALTVLSNNNNVHPSMLHRIQDAFEEAVPF
jgi:hypothetical protein